MCSEYVFIVFDFFFRFFYYIIDHIKTWIDKQKQTFFEGYYVSFGVYDKQNENYVHVYNYDPIYKFILILMESIFIEKKELLLPIKFDCIIGDTFAGIGSYYNEDKMCYIIRTHTQDEYINVKYRFVYCVVDDECDLTHEFEKFKHSLATNNTLTCKECIHMCLSFANKTCNCTDESVLKLVKDDTFDEIAFKGKDVLKIHNGS